jgi:uncharacterized SAM-binding protein YcdF (DUF218 family)
MFIFLSKFLPLFVYPLGLACVLIVAALIAARRLRLQRAILILALLVLFPGGNRWVAMSLTRSLEWRYLPPEQIPQAEVIVLLSGGTLAADYPRPIVELNSAGDRILYAGELYRQGKAKYILLTGGTIDWLGEPGSPTEEMATILEMLGVPREVMWFEPDSRNTYENAINSGRILKDKGITRILLVTSAWHMPRAVRLFEAQGLEVIPMPTDFTVTQKGWQELTRGDWKAQLINLIPTIDNLSLTTRNLKEYFGILVYDIRGWQ